MKLIISALLFCLFSTLAQASLIHSQANPIQDDRYFNSSGAYKQQVNKTIVSKTANHKTIAKYQKVRVEIARHRYKKVTARAVVKQEYYSGETFIQDTVTAPIRVIAAVIGGRPSGCPHRFCGCALSLNLFGRIIPHLNLAANWLSFPRAIAAPGMVAARHGHVFKLLAHVGGSTWKVWDANSGGGRTRVHNRSIAGFRIVNPSG